MSRAMDFSSDSENSDDEEKNKEEINSFKNQVLQNPNNYEAHVRLVQVLRKAGELQGLRESHLNMNKIFPLSPEIWMNWLSDEQKICTNSEERKFVIDLFKKAVSEYMSVQLWVEYIMFMLGGGNIENTRKVCEEALTAVGIHLAEGILVWQAVILVEQQYFLSLSPESEEAEKQRQRIINLYKRQARVPLMNMNKEEFMTEVTKWLGDKEDPHLRIDLENSYKKMTAKLPFEEALIKSTDETSKLESYRKYIDFARKSENPAYVQNIYERTVTDLCLNASMWEEYVQFVMEQFPGAHYVILPVCKRSRLNCPWSHSLFDLHITAIQMAETELGVHEVRLRISQVFNTTLNSGFLAASDMIEVWLSYLIFLRRQIVWIEENSLDHTHTVQDLDQDMSEVKSLGQSTSKIQNSANNTTTQTDQTLAQSDKSVQAQSDQTMVQIETSTQNLSVGCSDKRTLTPEHLSKFRDSCHEAMQSLREIDLTCRVARFFSRFEAEVFRNMESCRSLWNDHIMKINNNFKSADLWLEFIALERSYGDIKHCRKLYRRALERVWDEVEKIGASSLEFEQLLGSLETTLDFKRRYRDRLCIVQERRIQENTKEENKKQKQQRKQIEHKKLLHAPPTKNSSIQKTVRFESDVKDIQKHTGVKRNITEETVEQSIKKIRLDQKSSDVRQPKKEVGKEAHGEFVQHDPSLDYRSVFLSNLDFNVEQDEILKIFENCGEIESFRVARDFRGRSKGFGYLVFKEATSVPLALAKDRSPVGIRPLFVSKCNPKNKEKAFKFSEKKELNKLFVRGLPFSMSETDIKAVFEPHAPIKSFRLVTHRNGYSKGTCYIEYETSSLASSVQEKMDGVVLQDHKITVLISDPSVAKSKSNSQTIQPGASQYAPKTHDRLQSGSVGSSRQAPGTQRTKLSFVPRSLRNVTSKEAESGSTQQNGSGSSPMKSNEDFRKMLSK